MRPIRYAKLDVLLWNVYVGQKPTAVLAELKQMTAKHEPEIIVLSEAARSFNVLDDLPHYRRVQVKPDGATGRKVDEDGDVAILVRRDVALLRQRPIRMAQPWTGPKHGLPHEPRVYHAVLIKDQGVRWRILGGHWPTPSAKNTKAITETTTRVRRWMRLTGRKYPVIAAGDLNMLFRAVQTRLDARVGGNGVDLGAYLYCELVGKVNLGRHGSDHDAILLTFRKAVR